jgi:hypothetical protein
MADPASQCTNVEQIFDAPEDDRKYRFFNQPIEQIPNFKPNEPQILVHRPNGGLQWATIDKCLNVVTCMKLEASQLKVERRSIVVLKDFEIPDDAECDIELTDCESETEE